MVVLSAGSGGRVLLWTVDSDEGRLVLSAGFALIRQQVPHNSALSKVRLGIQGPTWYLQTLKMYFDFA